MTADDLTERIERAIQDADADTLDYERRPPDYGYGTHAAAVMSVVAPEIQAAKAEALREAARYFAGGLHCADMRTTPEETVRDLNRRATEYETGDKR